MDDFIQMRSHKKRYREEYPTYTVVPVLIGDNFSETDPVYEEAIERGILVGSPSGKGYTVRDS